MEKKNAFFIYVQDIGFMYEGESEGGSSSYAILTPEKPVLESWLKLAVLLGKTNFLTDSEEGLEKILKENINDDVFGISNYALFDELKNSYFDHKSNIQEEPYDNNHNLVDLRTVGQLTDQEFNDELIKLKMGELKEVSVPFKMKIQRFPENEFLMKKEGRIFQYNLMKKYFIK
jgi:hypothetical protein